MFGVVLISLALPFASVSCRSGEEEVELLRVRGYHLVTGGGPQLNPAVARATDRDALAESADIGPQPFAILAAAAALFGLLLGFARPRRARAVAAICGVVGTVSVLLASVRLDAQLTDALAAGPEAQAAVVVERESGYWVSLVAFPLAAAGAAGAYVSERPRPGRRRRPGR